MMIRTRIAPTPSGYLHTGNLYSFILTWLICRQQSGHLLLRIDDMDGPRVRDAFLEDIFETLCLIGLQPDEGPKNQADFVAHFSQEQRMELYESLLEELVLKDLVYACTCSRKELSNLAANGRKHCPCREKQIALEKGKAAWRIKLPDLCAVGWEDVNLGKVEINLTEAMGEFVIRRKDGLPAYQICSLADDLYFNINYIVRGDDLLASTAAQLYLAKLLHKNEFLQTRFYHHSLLLNEAGDKLSKSAGANAVKTFREQGGQPSTLIQQIAKMPGINVRKPLSNLQQLLELYKSNH